LWTIDTRVGTTPGLPLPLLLPLLLFVALGLALLLLVLPALLLGLPEPLDGVGRIDGVTTSVGSGSGAGVGDGVLVVTAADVDFLACPGGCVGGPFPDVVAFGVLSGVGSEEG
jgi:hypothetical protein